ncbi:MAG: tRNA (guanosine(46)-N7)-methyltransferase TrmB [Alphaproteobacteria bacterium]|nr:tRNA (guanosine(46)-N7)-methyltransferase TrmB [Alphaproteobacteria bacterium]
MEKQEIRTFGRRHGKKLSARQQTLVDELLPTLLPETGDILEIGFGAGEHVRDLARENPDKIIIGAEPFMNGVASLLSAITDKNSNRVLDEYKNIRIWADDVRDFLRATDSKFEQIWILHPDPWPKARHEKRRLLNAEFLNTLSQYLSPDGEIIIGTDHWEYFDWILEQIKFTALTATIPDMEIIQTRYQHKNKAGTTAPKYLVLHN